MPSWYAPDREPLVRPAVFIVLTVLVAVGFFAVFPDKEEFVESMLNSEPDNVSVAYLKLFLESRQGDPELRYTLADQLRSTQRLEEALRVLDPLIADPSPWQARANYLALEIHWSQAHSEWLADDLRAESKKIVEQKLTWLKDRELEPRQLEFLAGICLQSSEPKIAANIYERLAKKELGRKSQWLAEAARWYLASEDPHRAADLYVEATQSEKSYDRAQRWATLGLKALRASQRGGEAIHLAMDYVKRYPRNLELLRQAYELAIGQNQQALATNWGRKLIAHFPQDADLLSRQIDLELNHGVHSNTFTLAKKLLGLNPENIDYRKRFAEVAEWTGHPDLAMKEHMRLAKIDLDDTDHLREALRLSKAFYASQTFSDLIEVLSEREKLEEAELKLYIASCEREGLPEKAEGFLEDLIDKYPEELASYDMLIDLRKKLGEPEKLLSSIEEKEWRFGLSIKEVQDKAKLLWKLNRTEQALEFLYSTSILNCPDDLGFWNLLTELSWSLEANVEALSSHRMLWQFGDRVPLLADRLIILSRDQGFEEEAVDVALQAWDEFEIPRFLIQGMEAAWQKGEREQAVAMVKVAMMREPLFMEFEYYLILRAILLDRSGDHELARFYYERALELNPESPTARPGLLWLLINHRQLEPMLSYLNRWKEDAEYDSSLWAPYASGYQLLNRMPESIVWYQKHAEKNPEDYLWLLSFADALEQAKRPGSAWKLRNYVFTQVLPRVGKRLLRDDDSKADQEALRSYVVLTKGFFGVPAGDEWLPGLVEALDRPEEDSQLSEESSVGWYLKKGNFKRNHGASVKYAGANARKLAWEYLTSALNENDLSVVSNFFKEHTDQRIQLLNQGDPKASLAFEGGHEILNKEKKVQVTNGVVELIQDPSPRDLEQFEVELHHEDLLRVSGSYSEVGDLDTVGVSGFYSTSLGEELRLDFEASHQTYHTEELDLSQRSWELELTARLRWEQPRRRTHLAARVSTQAADSIVSLKASHQMRLEKYFDPYFEFEFNEQENLSTAIAIAGTRHKASVGARGSWTRRFFYDTQLAWKEYQSRSGSVVGQGPAIEFALGYTLRFDHPRWEVRASTSWLENNRVSSVPSAFRDLFDQNITVDSVLPARATVVGMGTLVTNRVYSLLEMRRKLFRYGVDLWGGWLLPSDSFIYEVRGNFGIRVFGDDEIRTDLFFSEGVGGIDNQRNRGISLSYQISF